MEEDAFPPIRDQRRCTYLRGQNNSGRIELNLRQPQLQRRACDPVFTFRDGLEVTQERVISGVPEQHHRRGGADQDAASGC